MLAATSNRDSEKAASVALLLKLESPLARDVLVELGVKGLSSFAGTGTEVQMFGRRGPCQQSALLERAAPIAAANHVLLYAIIKIVSSVEEPGAIRQNIEPLPPISLNIGIVFFER